MGNIEINSSINSNKSIVDSHLYTLIDSEMFKAYYKNESGKHILELNYDPLGILTAKNKDEIIYTMREIIEDIIDITYFNDDDIVYSIEHINEEENTKRYGNTISGIEELVLTEAVSKKVIPAKIKELIKSKTIRKKMLLRCGKDAFLLPEELKFPVKYPVLDRSGNVKKCEYHCGLIIAAYYRANEWKKKKPEYEKVAEKAKELYKKSKCDEDKKLPVHIRLNEQYIPDDIAIFTLVDLLDKIR